MALGDIAKLADSGKGKGYLTYNEVNGLIPHDVHSPEDLDDEVRGWLGEAYRVGIQEYLSSKVAARP